MSSLEDDFNTSKAIAVLFGILSKGNALLTKNALSKKSAKEILTFLKDIDAIFGFMFFKRKVYAIPSDVTKLAKEREEYRKSSQWKKADEIRKEIIKIGWEINDTPQGPKLKKIS
ncbi:hypothetical protein IIB49_02425 [Patescibacteria group bacterium]|nr:hypothetical protein [Patescibacteria group bacterium]